MSNEDDTSYDDGYQQGSSDTVAITQLLIAKRAIISDMD